MTCTMKHFYIGTADDLISLSQINKKNSPEHGGLDKMATIVQTTVSNIFPWKYNFIHVFRFQIYQLFSEIHLAIG